MKRHLLSVIVVLFAATAVFAVTGGENVAKGVVNINSASSEQLQLLPRVGPALSERIILFRETNGAFKSADELVAVKGIGEKSMEYLAPYVATSGETTLTEKVRLPRQPKADPSD